jgi:uncharacterized membrane protein
MAANGNQSICRSICSCTVDRLKVEGLWTNVLTDRLTPADQTRISEMAQQCLAASPPPPP